MRRFLTLVAVLALSACGTRESASPEIRGSTGPALRDTLVAGLREYAAAAQAFDSARVMAMLADEPTFSFVDGQTVYSRDGFGRLVGEAFAALRSFEARFNFDSMSVVELSPSSAVTIVPYVDLMTDRAGTTTTVRGVVTWVWAIRNDQWRLLAGHAAPLPPEVSR